MNTKKLNAVIIDDEELGRKNLNLLLDKFCPTIQVVQLFDDTINAYNYLVNNEIDIVFLDISMPKMNGFDFLQLFTERSFEVIFVTAYEEFGIQAIRAKAIDYLTKPISVLELQEAVNRVIVKHEPVSSKQTNFVSISHSEGTNIVSQDDIVYLEADDYLTKIHLNNHQKIVVSKNIKHFEELLDGDKFIRIHKSFMININFIDSYSKQDGGTVKLKYPIILPIARRKFSQFLQIIAQNVRN